jgi:hypothetical protein
MGKYSRFSERQQIKPRPWKIHPIWRGLGCIMLIIIPILSFAGAQLMIAQGLVQRYVVIPYDLAKPLFGFTLQDGYYEVTPISLLVAASLTLVGFAFIMIIYTVIYNVLGPKRYGPLDAPPEHYKRRKQIKTK